MLGLEVVAALIVFTTLFGTEEQKKALSKSVNQITGKMAYGLVMIYRGLLKLPKLIWDYFPSLAIIGILAYLYFR